MARKGFHAAAWIDPQLVEAVFAGGFIIPADLASIYFVNCIAIGRTITTKRAALPGTANGTVHMPDQVAFQHFFSPPPMVKFNSCIQLRLLNSSQFQFTLDSTDALTSDKRLQDARPSPSTDEKSCLVPI
ncbi:hypothetical protein [Flavihumibacter solisilvae]|uniref:Uncharacterized protein n=1 Tax=Flavihumibacter solisilvae TaxID=1349421 RepID=A0A0C1ILE6_9BACT|nr:hypothetical protein [Flavihumibacter solisilvae]KIC95025.1 hypothetical protein OI18_09085 [Flavihumibacter solisilvae]